MIGGRLESCLAVGSPGCTGTEGRPTCFAQAKEHSGIGYNQAAEHAHCVLAAPAGSPLCLPPRQEKLLVGAGIAWRYNFNLGGLVWPPLRNSGLESGKILHNVDVCAYIARMGGVPATMTISSSAGSCMTSPGVNNGRDVSCRDTMRCPSQGERRCPA